MSDADLIVLALDPAEAAHLDAIVTDFAALVAAENTPDDAIARLNPDVYPDDSAASAEFRRLTPAELLRRRADDAAVVQETIADATTAMPAPAVRVVLDSAQADAWLRTLSAIRLVLASRLGISSDDDVLDDENPLVGVYEWLGFRLDGLVRAIDA